MGPGPHHTGQHDPTVLHTAKRFQPESLKIREQCVVWGAEWDQGLKLPGSGPGLLSYASQVPQKCWARVSQRVSQGVSEFGLELGRLSHMVLSLLPHRRPDSKDRVSLPQKAPCTWPPNPFPPRQLAHPSWLLCFSSEQFPACMSQTAPSAGKGTFHGGNK